jgi:hypothetical protein
VFGGFVFVVVFGRVLMLPVLGRGFFGCQFLVSFC